MQLFDWSVDFAKRLLEDWDGPSEELDPIREDLGDVLQRMFEIQLLELVGQDMGEARRVLQARATRLGSHSASAAARSVLIFAETRMREALELIAGGLKVVIR